MPQVFHIKKPLHVHRKGKGGVFRGRISVEGLEIEDIQDGTGMYMLYELK